MTDAGLVEMLMIESVVWKLVMDGSRSYLNLVPLEWREY